MTTAIRITTKSKPRIIALLILSALLTSSCGFSAGTSTPAGVDKTLNRLATVLLDVTTATAALQTTVIDGNKAGLISNADAALIVNLCIKILEADKQASDTVRSLSKLDDASKGKVILVLQPVIEAAANAVATGTAGIRNQSTRAKVQAGLLTVQTALNSIQLILASTGGN